MRKSLKWMHPTAHRLTFSTASQALICWHQKTVCPFERVGTEVLLVSWSAIQNNPNSWSCVLLSLDFCFQVLVKPHVEANGLAHCVVALPQLKRCDSAALEENSRIWKSAQKTEVRWSFVSLFLLIGSEVSLSSLVCRTGLHPTLPGPGLPSQFCTTMTRCIDIKQLAHHPVAAQGQEVGCLRWSHRLHLRPPPANQQPIYPQSQQSNQSLWVSSVQ